MLKGNERHAELDYPDEEYQYYLLADRFGWLPTQVDEQPAYLLDWLLSIASVVEQTKVENAND